MMRTAISIVALWRPTVRTIDEPQVTLSLEPVKLQDQVASVSLALHLTIPLPPQDPSLPGVIEAHVHHAGLEVQRALFRALIEFADRQLVLARRQGKDEAGVQLRGTRPFTFKTLFGSVAVRRTRITHHADGSCETPSATAWGTSHRCALTRGLREAICDQFADESARESRDDIGERAGEPDLVSKATVLEVVHQEGTALIEAIRLRADRATQADTDNDNDTDTDNDNEAVVVQLDEVTTKAQPHTGRKEIWAFTAVVMIAGWSHLLVDNAQEGLYRQVAALLHKSGVMAGARPLLVVADGAGWIRAWYEGLGVPIKAMVLCWYHLRKRCYQKISGSGLPKAEKKPLLGRVLSSLWEGKVDEAIRALREFRESATRPGWIDELIAYLEARRAYLPNYKARKEAGQVNASHRVEKFNDWAVSDRCKGRGMSWTAEGVLSLAVLEATRRNGELETWRRDGELPELKVPRPSRKAA
jgi:hypothetical protein